jgi:hypothetical protein
MPAAMAAMMLRAIASVGGLPYRAAYLDFTSSMTDRVCARLRAAVASAVALSRAVRGFFAGFFLTAFFLATIFIDLSPIFFCAGDIVAIFPVSTSYVYFSTTAYR